mgnify:FL=1
MLVQLLTSFQYWFEAGGEMFMDHFTMRPTWWRWLLWEFGLREYPYTPRQIEDAKGVLLDGIVKSIDIMYDPEKVEEMKAARLHRKRGGKYSDCIWQTFTKGEEPAYWCIKHKKEAPMIEGSYPEHKNEE